MRESYNGQFQQRRFNNYQKNGPRGNFRDFKVDYQRGPHPIKPQQNFASGMNSNIALADKENRSDNIATHSQNNE